MPPRRRVTAPEESVNDERVPVDPIQRLVDLLGEALRGRNEPVPPNPPVAPVANFKDFKSVGPPEFMGTTDPIVAQTWIKEMEKAFAIARVGEDQKTVFATYMLRGEVNYWWEANQQRAGEGIIPWERFKTLFFENYFLKSMKNRMEVKFLELK